jgi:hypothetical protein
LLTSNAKEGRERALPSLADRAIAALARQRFPPALSYALTVTIMLAVASLQRLLPLYHVPYLLLIPAIFTVSLAFGLGEGLLATLIAAFLANYLFMGPAPQLRMSRPAAVTSLLFIVFSTFIVLVCDAVRRSALRQSAELERYRVLRVAAEESARALEESEEALRRLNETLEGKVEERTAALDEAREALRQSQKMEALGQLTGGVAHDFNNLLAGVVGGLELARSRLAQGRPDEAPRYLEIAEECARRGAALTRRLLAFSRRQAPTTEDLALEPLIGGMEDLIRRTAGPGVRVTVDVTSPCWSIRADRSQLENALLNLAINARDAMDGRGELAITLANKVLDPSEADAQAVASGDYVRLTVADTGCGMSPEVASRAFEPFFTTKPAGQGTGLGLSMIYAFVRQAGGAVWIESASGEGARVNLLLPRHDAQAQAPSASEPRPGSPAPVSPGQTVLVVDDEPAVRAVLTDALRALGYAALAAEDGAGGLEMLRGDRRIDLLISDLGLPGQMNGSQMVDRARELRPDLKVLFITGYADAEAEAMLGPGVSRLTKPFELETLRQAVGEVLLS